eukprot:7976230-Pyramimonas_sp.AAC.1
MRNAYSFISGSAVTVMVPFVLMSACCWCAGDHGRQPEDEASLLPAQPREAARGLSLQPRRHGVGAARGAQARAPGG